MVEQGWGARGAAAGGWRGQVGPGVVCRYGGAGVQVRGSRGVKWVVVEGWGGRGGLIR